MMIFKLDVFVTVAILASTPWVGGSYSKAIPEPPPRAARVLLQPISPVALQPLPEIEFQPFPVAEPGTYYNTYTPRNCTWYVASMKRIPDSWGNASTWVLRAQVAGITVSPVPIKGAIAQHDGGLGHVAVVRDVVGDQVLIDEMNYDYNGGVRQDWQPISAYVYIWI